MLKKANIQWSGKTLRNQIEKGQVSFDCAVQRNPVWDMSRKSLLIHSMIEGYPIHHSTLHGKIMVSMTL